MRDAFAAELAAVVALRLAAYEEHLRALPDDIVVPYLDEMHDAGRTATGRLIVAVDQAAIVGAVLFLPDAADAHPAPARSSAVRLLAVAPHLRGRGIGEMLMRHCIGEAEAAGSEHVILHTAPFMHEARRLYLRLGFTRTPAYDFDPHTHYAGRRPDPGTAEVQGLAYSLRVPRRE